MNGWSERERFMSGSNRDMRLFDRPQPQIERWIGTRVLLHFSVLSIYSCDTSSCDLIGTRPLSVSNYPDPISPLGEGWLLSVTPHDPGTGATASDWPSPGSGYNSSQGTQTHSCPTLELMRAAVFLVVSVCDEACMLPFMSTIDAVYMTVYTVHFILG